MTEQEYISSGILELYVAGALSEKENFEIYQAMQKFSAVKEEVANIENSIVALTAATAPFSVKFLVKKIKKRLFGKETKAEETKNIKTLNWGTYLGWAASILLFSVLIWTLFQNNQLQNNLEQFALDQKNSEKQILQTQTDLEKSNQLLAILRDKELISIPLKGQENFSTASAVVYWNKKTEMVYVDVANLPPAPEGKVYQLWSLTLEPLSPTDLGTLDNLSSNKYKIFAKKNINSSEAFAITLEPTGGSKTPTMEALYTLGLVISG